MAKFYFLSAVCFYSLVTSAQPAVRNEPRHHNVFENEHIRILDVFIPPGDTTQFHIHNTPSIFITFTKTATGSQLAAGEPIKDISTAGNSWYDSLVTPRIHRVWNEDTSWFHVMDIELLAGKAKTNQPPLQDPFLQLFSNNPLANGYHVLMQPGKKMRLPESSSGYLLLSTGSSIVEYNLNDHPQRRSLQSGHYLWIEPGELFSISSIGNRAEFLLLQLK